jgi:ADP-heptose:LPS heptosyltransferase
MAAHPSTHLFLVGKDYHLGDLLWLTAVLAEYRRRRDPHRLVVGCPDRPISRILEHNPLIDSLLYDATRWQLGPDAVVYDLRPLPVARAMIMQWRRYLPWLYYRDLWLRERGQWLATFLGLGRMTDFRPVLRLVDEDRSAAGTLEPPYVVLAPHTGSYSISLLGSMWRRIKGWPEERWMALVGQLQAEGYRVVTLSASDQPALPGTMRLAGLPIRQAAGVIERAAMLLTVESGLWFIAAALATPFVIIRWWLPRSVDWPAPMGVPYRLIYPSEDSVSEVLAAAHELAAQVTV